MSMWRETRWILKELSVEFEEILVSGARKCDEQKRALHETLTRKGKRESKADD